MRSFFLGCILMTLILARSLSAQTNHAPNEFSMLFYNTENFFDCENDSSTNDEEFLANATRNWTSKRLRSKAERLAKVILAAGRWNAPVIVGLCEVENLDVLESLVRNETLARFHYKIVQKDSPDPRGIDVALLYRPDLFRPLGYQAIPVVVPENKSFRTRDILKVHGVLNDCDTLTVFVNHWPSRYGGIMETEKYRNRAAEILKSSVNDLFAKNPSAKVICMGDFNATPRDASIRNVLRAAESDNPGSSGDLVNLSAGWMSEGIQTIKSKYRWEVFDQLIVSDSFLKAVHCFTYTEAVIFKDNFLLEPDVAYGGVKPRRTYTGLKYHDGFSDHLPVVLRFQLLAH